MEDKLANKHFLVIGAFDFTYQDFGGQPVKTRELYNTLKRHLVYSHVDFFETIGWKRNPLKSIVRLVKKIKHSDVIIMVPAQNGLKILTRLILMFRKKECLVYYDVIGGWLPEIVKNNNPLKRMLKRFQGIWVETTRMLHSLNEQNFHNVHVLYNFKDLKRVPVTMVESRNKSIRLCTFSRVMEKKGIEIAINSVLKINNESDSIVFTLGKRFRHLAEDFGTD